jgi:hypothetical protein
MKITDKSVKYRKVLDITKDEHGIHFDVRISFPPISEKLEKDVFAMKEKLINGGEYDEERDIFFTYEFGFFETEHDGEERFYISMDAIENYSKLKE